ncbi:hypothetical protein MNBD_GAMMA01-1543 [hydrothermal vent metagenome]|uniref:Uncharacterized protein n=1 Tax=hydrothermal vent metagenome TaxID=652676 RepID=A0A3B0UX63_9ZZZZ
MVVPSIIFTILFLYCHLLGMFFLIIFELYFASVEIISKGRRALALQYPPVTVDMF